MNDCRYYITVTNDSAIFTLEVYRVGAYPKILHLTAHEPFHLDTPEGLIELRTYFNRHGWELGVPLFNTDDHYSCEIIRLETYSEQVDAPTPLAPGTHQALH